MSPRCTETLHGRRHVVWMTLLKRRVRIGQKNAYVMRYSTCLRHTLIIILFYDNLGHMKNWFSPSIARTSNFTLSCGEMWNMIQFTYMTSRWHLWVNVQIYHNYDLIFELRKYMEYLADIFRNVSEPSSSLLDVNNTKITRYVHLYDHQMAAPSK